MITLKTFHHSPRLAELKVTYKRRRSPSAHHSQLPSTIGSPQTAEQYLRLIWDEDTLELIESVYVLCLNAAHAALGWVRVSTGGFDSARVDCRVVFSIALQAASSAIIMAHNHPSGDVRPSEEDRRLTERVKEAGRVLAIPLLDHLIIGKDSVFSFADEGLI